MGCTGSAAVHPERVEQLFSPQLPPSCVLKTLRSSNDPVAAIVELEKCRLLPHNKVDLWQSLGLEGYPPQGMTREEIVGVFALFLKGCTEG